MSHDLEKTVTGQTLGWLFAPAWHHLGTIRPELGRDMAAARLASGVTWSVNARSLACDGAPVPGFKAISRGTDSQVYDVRTTRYSVGQPDMWDAALVDVMLSAPDTRLDSILSLKDGAITIATLALGADDVTGKGDVVESYLTTYCNYRSRAAGIAHTISRTVCNNTFSANVSRADADGTHAKVRHTGDLSGKVAAASELLKHVAAQRGQTIATFRLLAEKPWSGKQLDALVTRLYPATSLGKRQISKIERELARVKRAESAGAPVDLSQLSSLTGAEVIESMLLDEGARVGDVSLADILAETEKVNSRAKRLIEEAYEGAPGATPGTAWGAFNAVTHYTTHSRGRSVENRVATAFAPNDALLQNVLEIVQIAA